MIGFLPTADSGPGSAREDLRARILAAAAGLLASGGRDALTTRAAAAAAGVQATAIYRLFGDKDGLVDALAAYGFASYLAEKQVHEPGPDPVEDLRAGWDLHVGFGLANPALYSLMYGDPRPGVRSAAVGAAEQILKEHVQRIAKAGRLRVSEQRAVGLVQASGRGVVLALLAVPQDARDPGLADAAREAVIAAITTDAPAPQSPRPATAAIALRAVLPDATGLSGGERLLLEELLDRLAARQAP
jgi:AcrR family transcriptional regulator